MLSVAGNHDDDQWSDYRYYIKTRVQRADGLDCSGEPGIKASCNFQNIDIVQVAPGLHNFGRSESSTDYARFIDQSFSTATNNWRICSWHMNQRRMQTGNKEDATGWEVFDACLDAGAMVAMGHEHAYSRTYLLSDFENQTVVHTRDDMTLKRGQSIAFVSGLGGWEVREQVRYDDDWFASIYTATQDATHGALFCNFGTSTADCYFKAIDGTVQDTFTLRRGQSEPQTQDSGYVFERTDRPELRWIDVAANGRLGSTWIDRECAERMGGTKARGDWRDLNELAPELDGIANSCIDSNGNTRPTSPEPSPGFVFSRTDKTEFRWLDVDRNGTLGSIWVDPDCVEQLGGVKMKGDWEELNELAPALDGISPPTCS